MKNLRGFSLIELLVVIAIAAVLASLAVPSFQSLIASSNLTSATNDLVATLARAKSDAIRRGNRVTVCISSDGATCTTSGHWTQGWIMFNDKVHPSGSAAVESTDDITAITAAQTNSIEIKSNQAYFSYSADGQAKSMDGGSGAGRIRVCNTSPALTNDTRAREIVINWVGRVNVEKPTGVAATCPAPT